MGMEMKLQVKLSQQLVMTPQLVQAIRLLQLSRLELVEEIRKELDGNPLLADDGGDGPSARHVARANPQEGHDCDGQPNNRTLDRSGAEHSDTHLAARATDT